MLGRDTEWRQGHILTDEAAHALGLVNARNSNQRVVVITHDCDLPNESEQFVEVIAGIIVSTPNNMLTNARNPRRLQLKYASSKGVELLIEINHANRVTTNKSDFARFCGTPADFHLSSDDKRALKQWLAAKYGRPAFPNTFETRLRKEVSGKNIEQHISRIAAPNAAHLVGLFFDLGEDRHSELADGVPYVLSISVVYDATEGGQEARQCAETVAASIRSIFVQAYGTAAEAFEIALEECEAVADTFMTLADLRKVDQWRLEYVSLREEPVGNFFQAGERSF